MRISRCLFTAALIFGLSGLAKADPIDFKMNVLDPTPQPTYTLIDGTSPFAVSFGACPANITATGCFTGYNDTTNLTFTSLDLTFTNTTSSSDPNNFINYLNGQPATCETTSPLSLFAASSCSLSADESTYTLDFSGGSGIAPGQFFFITETGPEPEAFGVGSGVVGVAPEPSSILLLSTGIAMIGLYFARQKKSAIRAAARISQF